MPCYSPLKGYRDEATGGLTFRRENTKAKMEVACGQCIGCRLDRSRMWAARMVHEAGVHDLTGGNSFVTLTYRDPDMCSAEQLRDGFHIPSDWSLRKKHFQDFMKRLRKGRSPDRIKFYHCGEYGNKCMHGISLDLVRCPMCNLGRPHYHACLFNCSFSDRETYAVQSGVTRWTSDELSSYWKHGFVDVGDVTVQSAGYVARYILDKVNGDGAADHYIRVDELGEIFNLQPEYATMSNGIGAAWFDEFHSDVFPSDELPVPGTGILHKVPRYYDERLRRNDEDMYLAVKKKRELFRRENADEYSPERLMAKYKVKKAQVGPLKKRSL